VVLALNLPPRLLAVTLLWYALFLPLVFLVPPLPVWLVLVLSAALIVLGHKSQAWSHRVWTEETDMTEFNKKYRKGPKLFLLLSVYELPILLNYLVLTGRGAVSAPPPVAPPGPGRAHSGENGVSLAGQQAPRTP
jgi:hypothetical protein